MLFVQIEDTIKCWVIIVLDWPHTFVITQEYFPLDGYGEGMVFSFL